MLHRDLSQRLLRFIDGLAVRDELEETAWQRFEHAVRQELPQQAIERYEELFRRLAGQFPEVAFWSSLIEHQATRSQIQQAAASTHRLEQAVAAIPAGRAPDERRSAPARAYRAVLERPLAFAGDLPVPTLRQISITPDFRIAAAPAAHRVARESWWRHQPLRHDLHAHLIGHLTGRNAVTARLLVLGQPGSDKSVLTRILAGLLPPSDFLVVRVAPRNVPPDSDVQAQIEHAVRDATGASLTWPQPARSADGTLPVGLLDGFDELLQTTGVLWIASSRAADSDTLRAAYDVCLGFIRIPYLVLDHQDTRREYRAMVFLQLDHDRDRSPADWVQDALRTEPEPPPPDWEAHREAGGGLMATQSGRHQTGSHDASER
ncbi:hypothetical protein GCM10009850_119040 [Nonomuraea monospora]|uniref:NACHT N-terminal Helical domain-containing protein n=1 Tax=Nonomuraea monospora TaxID=568818 RepID=A0ABN3D3K8_9ACTN